MQLNNNLNFIMQMAVFKDSIDSNCFIMATPFNFEIIEPSK